MRRRASGRGREVNEDLDTGGGEGGGASVCIGPSTIWGGIKSCDAGTAEGGGGRGEGALGFDAMIDDGTRRHERGNWEDGIAAATGQAMARGARERRTSLPSFAWRTARACILSFNVLACVPTRLERFSRKQRRRWRQCGGRV
jgi:hypothetical protein